MKINASTNSEDVVTLIKSIKQDDFGNRIGDKDGKRKKTKEEVAEKCGRRFALAFELEECSWCALVEDAKPAEGLVPKEVNETDEKTRRFIFFYC